MSPDEARGMYARAMSRAGETVTFRRITGGTPSDLAGVRVYVRGYRPEELVGGIQQGDREVIALASDVTYTPELRAGDKVLFSGRLHNIETVNPRRVQGETVAYELRVRG